MKSIRLTTLALLLTAAAASQAGASALLEDDHLTGLVVHESGGANGGLHLNGDLLGYFGSGFVSDCGGLSSPSSVVVSGSTASYTGECGNFDVTAVVRLLSPLAGAPSNSAGFEEEFTFTNDSISPTSLRFLRYSDDDMGLIVNDDFGGYDAAASTLWVLDTAADPDIMRAITASTDDPDAEYGWDVDNLVSVGTTFPMNNPVGPVGPTDIAWAMGYQTTVDPGQTVTFRFRHMFVRGTTTVPSDFDFSSCYADPVDVCGAGGGGSLTLADSLDDSKDKWNWKLTKGAATSFDDFADPTAGGDYSLCMYDMSNGPIANAHLPASVSKWEAKSAKGFLRKDKAGTDHGITKAQLKAGAAGKSKIAVLGKGTGLPDLNLAAITGPLLIQFHNGARPGTCWESTFTTPLVQEPFLYKAKAN